MSYRDPSILQWRTSRVVTSADVSSNPFTPNAYDGSIAIPSHPWSAVTLMGLGRDAALEIATVDVIGWMDSKTVSGNGPGIPLVKISFTLGTEAITAEAPISDGKWNAASTWLRAKTAVLSDNLCNAATLTTGGGVDGDILVVVPTVGFTHLWLEIGVTTFTTAEFGVLWRPCSLDQLKLA